ncbi:MAG: AAC(3) family N-acetyltransferase [Armatimonadetes bacterium]|nr:AAC(3) family N-acetyltransferase [Armatimonadota bacterium]
MQPEKGDPSVRVGVSDIAAGFRAVGVQPGDILIYHGSLSSMGTVEGGPTAVIDGALEVVGPDGTVVMPTLWYSGHENPDDFDIATSPAYIGRLAEAFRTDTRSIRSNHFSHSISAIGPQAAELTADHEKSQPLHTPWSLYAFGPGSPWDRLYDWNALYCFIGVTMMVCTMKHYIEARIVEECLGQAAPERRPALSARLMRIGQPGVWPFYNSEAMEELLTRRELVARSRIGSASIRGVRMRVLVDETFPILRGSPEEWFDPAFLAWREECLAG